jgi:hypothetical protein
MRISISCVVTATSWLLSSDAFHPHIRFTSSKNIGRALKSGFRDLHEFDHLLSEGSQTEFQQQQQRKSGTSDAFGRRSIQMPEYQGGVTVLASSSLAPRFQEESIISEAQEAEADPYADLFDESPSLQQYQLQEQPTTISQGIENRLKNMDLQDIVSTLIIPSIIAFAGFRWVFNRASERVSSKIDATLDSFASEMVYHDGDFEEMKLCLNDYNRKLVWLGPTKSQAMLKRYLQLYSKKKTVSPQSIRYVNGDWGRCGAERTQILEEVLHWPL